MPTAAPIVLVDQPTAAPTRKVGAQVISGALVTVIVALLKQAGYEVSIELAGALIVLISFGISYKTRDEVQPDVVVVTSPK